MDQVSANLREALELDFFFSSRRLSIGLDIVLAGPQPSPETERLLQQRRLLAGGP